MEENYNQKVFPFISSSFLLSGKINMKLSPEKKMILHIRSRLFGARVEQRMSSREQQEILLFYCRAVLHL